MALDTSNWGWPQWIILVLLFLRFASQAGLHGKPRVKWVGPEKGQPEEYSGFSALGAFALWLFALIGGGFFA